MATATLDLGNNDFSSDYYINVTSHEACLPTLADGSGAVVSINRASFGEDNQTIVYPVATNEWLQTVAEQQSHMFVDELEKTTFACGGYLNVRNHSRSNRTAPYFLTLTGAPSIYNLHPFSDSLAICRSSF